MRDSMGYAYRGKRALDLVVAFLLLILFSVPIAIIALAIYVESGRPIIFSQSRRGYKGRPFRIFKFRSMVNAQDNGQPVRSRVDSRITRVGRFIRRTRLDELPQVLNVLNGQMSIVGPRPLIEFDVALCKCLGLDLSSRDKIKPGITGLAPVSLLFSGQQYENDIEYMYWRDRIYVINACFVLDVAIMIMTIPVMIIARSK